MSLNNLILSTLLVVSWAAYEIHGRRYLFHLPWACAVLYNPGRQPWSLIGACSILNADHVLVSVNNFAARRPSAPHSKYYEDLDKLRVVAGSNYMNGTNTHGKTPYAQIKNVNNFYIGRTKHWDVRERTFVWDSFIEKPLTQSKLSQVQSDDNSGISSQVGILVLNGRFSWSVYVRPITMNFLRTGYTNVAFSNFKDQLNKGWIPHEKCITYSWSEKENKIRYHEVMFLPAKNCLDVFCSWDLTVCNSFPNATYLFCFKSNKFIDVCPNARGAALYCPGFASYSVFAILTTAPSCGLRNMPGVYTGLDLVIKLYEYLYLVDFSKMNRPELGDVFKLDQKNEDYEGI